MTNGRRPGGELAYALITPYSLHKSRTGGILARLLWGNVKLVAARMYAPRPGSGFIEGYCDSIYDPQERHIDLRYQKMVIEYVIRNLGRPNARGISNRFALLVFRGPDAVEEIAEATGHISRHVQGDNVRGTFGDFFREERTRPEDDPAYQRRKRLLGKYEALARVQQEEPRNDFFEPAVLIGPGRQMAEAHLKLFRRHAYSDGGLVVDALDRLGEEAETSLVVLKPESFRHRNPLPGNLIDFFARSGMYITGMKMIELSVEDAREFYAAKVEQFRRQLKDMVADRARDIVRKARRLAERAVSHMGADPAAAFDPAGALMLVREAERLFGGDREPGQVKPAVVGRIFEELAERLQNLRPPGSLYGEIAEQLKDEHARAEFGELIRYMTGKDPLTHRPLQEDEASCMALLYSGTDALRTIRKRLKELREVYGQNVLQNRAHASDPEEDPQKEMDVLGMPTARQGESRPCDVEKVVNEFCGPPAPGEEPL
jgi:nucleoside diphosphate kinase